MKKNIPNFFRAVSAVVFLPALVISLALSSLETHAAGQGGVVQYSPSTQTVEGNIPFASTYTLFVTAPSNLAGNTTVGFNVGVNSAPAGISTATAQSFVTFSPASLAFTTPGQTLSAQVIVTFTPAALPGGGAVSSASYVYQINTTGWGVPVTDGGAFINATASISSTSSGPLTTSVVTPVDASVVTLNVGEASRLINFTFTATAVAGDTLTGIDASVDGVGLSLAFSDVSGAPVASANGLVTANAAGSMVLAPGAHSVTVNAHNLAGNGTGFATDTNVFSINPYAQPPVAAVSLPNGTAYTLRAGDGTLNVPFTFTVSRPTAAGDVNPLTVQLDGNAASYTLTTPVNVATVAGSGTRTFQEAEVAAGVSTHTVTVQGTDVNGASNVASATFTINYLRPTPTITIAAPTTATITIPAGATSVDVPFTINSASNNTFNVDSVVAWLDTGAIFTPATTGLGTVAGVSTGTLAGLTAGTHTLHATVYTAGNAKISATTSVTFLVKSLTNLPPAVIINTPPAGSTYTRLSSGPALSIPMTFTGTSNTPGAVITAIAAKLDGVALTVTPTNLNTAVATGASTMSVTTAGTHTISVSAVDAYGTATATSTFVVNVVAPRSICGNAFFDVDCSGAYNCSDFGLSGVTVNLLSSGTLVATSTTNSCGSYTFSNLLPGTYTVAAVAPSGLKFSTASSVSVTPAATGCGCNGPSFGFCLDFAQLRTMCAGGYSQGFWKDNVDKAVSCTTKGVQVSAQTLNCYTSNMAHFALSPFDCLTLKSAQTTLGYNGPTPTSLLAKQLIASEYNYQNGGYINGNKTLTMLFCWWGEYVVANPSKYTSTYVLWAKDWCDAYNNSHGGLILGPQ